MFRKKQNKNSFKDCTKVSMKKTKQFCQEMNDSLSNNSTKCNSEIGNSSVFKKKNTKSAMVVKTFNEKNQQIQPKINVSLGKRNHGNNVNNGNNEQLQNQKNDNSKKGKKRKFSKVEESSDIPQKSNNFKRKDQLSFSQKNLNKKIVNDLPSEGKKTKKKKMFSETSHNEKNCEVKDSSLKESKLKQDSKFEVSFPRGKKIFKADLSSSFDKKKESIVNIFDQTTMPQHHEENIYRKKNKNKFNQTEQQHDMSDKKPSKKKCRSSKKNKFQQFPNRFSMEEAKLGLKSMLTKGSSSSAEDSVRNVDQMAADFKKLVQKKMVSQGNALKFKELERNKKLSDQLVMLKKLDKKQNILQKTTEKKFNAENMKNKASSASIKKISKKSKKKPDYKDNSRINEELDSESQNDSQDDSATGTGVDSATGTGVNSATDAQKNNKKVKNESPKVLRGFKDRIDTRERLNRTLFVGNLPLHVDRKVLKKLFMQYGDVESARIRSSIPAKLSMTKKISNITKKYHSDVHSLMGYVVFKTVEDARCGLALNGSLVENHHIKVDTAIKPKKYDDERSAFIGNLPFDVEEESLWVKFSKYGHIESVRVVRDTETGVGKGYGFIMFKESKSVEDAIKMGVEIEGREIRIKPLNDENKNKELAKNKKRRNTFKSGAIKDKRSLKYTCKKSIKKLIKKRKMSQQKKKISSLFDKKKKKL